MVTKPRDVFINCPFDDEYTPSFRALVFGILASGFRVRCALEMDDGAETRIDKLYRIIDESRYSIHDFSRTELDAVHRLPRFNMPLELGIFLGAKRFGDEHQKSKRCLIIDIERFRYQRFISDLAGMDITPHGAEPRQIVRVIRNWLVTVSRRRNIPPPEAILNSYDLFIAALPDIAHLARLDAGNLIFADYERLVLAWIKEGQGQA